VEAWISEDYPQTPFVCMQGRTGELLQLEHHPFCVHVSRERFKLKFQAASISLSSCHSCALLVEEQSQTPLMTLLFGV